jgi:predicted NUDIX family phosphoesterase
MLLWRAMEEKVLVFNTTILRDIGEFQGYTFEIEKYLNSLLLPDNLLFLPRSLVEVDERYKQIIPYVVIQHGNSLFSYTRGDLSSEMRLVRKRSIGIGGHIQPIDTSTGCFSGISILQNAAKREISEEVIVNSFHTEHTFALINDDSTEVGRVHFGVVFLWHLVHPSVVSKEEMIAEAGFSQIDELVKHRNNFETWSQLVLDALVEV